MNETKEDFIFELREFTSEHAFNWFLKFDNSNISYWNDNVNKEREYKEHPAYSLTFDQCIEALAAKYEELINK